MSPKLTSTQQARALIVVDVQNDFCPGGSLATESGSEAAKRIAAFITDSKDYDFIVATKDWHIDPGAHFSDNPDFVDTWPVHCVAESEGAKFHPALAEIEFDAIFRKGEYSAAYSGFEGAADGSVLHDYLIDRGITDLDIVGIATDYCVRATALDAIKNGFKVRILQDLVAPVTEEAGACALAELAKAGATLI